MIDYRQINCAQKVSEQDSFTSERYTQFIKYFRPQDTNIIDIGCNTGKGGEILRKENKQINIIGIDIVINRLKQIRTNTYNYILLASATNIPLKSNSYDIIIGGEFIEHISRYDVDIVLKEFFRVLKENGRLILTTPNPDSFLVKMGRDSVLKDPSHLSIMNKNELKSKLISCGFRHTIIKGSGKAIRIFGQNFFIFSIYGSYLIMAEKYFK